MPTTAVTLSSAVISIRNLEEGQEGDVGWSFSNTWGCVEIPEVASRRETVETVS